MDFGEIINWIPRATKPSVATANKPVARVLSPMTRVLTAPEIVWANWLLATEGCVAKETEIEYVNLYSSRATVAAISAPLKALRGVVFLGFGAESGVLGWGGSIFDICFYQFQLDSVVTGHPLTK